MLAYHDTFIVVIIMERRTYLTCFLFARCLCWLVELS